MADQVVNPADLSIERATKEDLPPILKLFDEAVVWLNQRGIEKQWGTQPFTAHPELRERFMNWIDQEVMFVARLRERVVGSLVLNPVAPEYIAGRWESFPSSAFYLEAFATARDLAGQNIGRVLLDWAEGYTRATGRSTIWLDCWGDNPDLVRYYQQRGFMPREEFLVKEWRGQLFEKQVARDLD